MDWRVVTFDTAQSSGTPRRDADIGQVKDTENNRRSIGNIDVFCASSKDEIVATLNTPQSGQTAREMADR